MALQFRFCKPAEDRSNIIRAHPSHLRITQRLGAAHHLSVSMRHASDPEFSAFLTYIRQERDVSAQRIHDALYDWWEYTLVPPPEGKHGPPNRVCGGKRTCEITKEDIAGLADHLTTVLCSHRHQVAEVNRLLFDKFFPVAADRVALPVKLSFSSTPAGSEMDYEIKTWFESPDFAEIQDVALGARVMITDNSHLAKGVCNGATGVVEGFKRRSNGEIMTVLVKLDHNGEIANVTRTKFDVYYRDQHKWAKCTFPLTLSYAMTGEEGWITGIMHRAW